MIPKRKRSAFVQKGRAISFRRRAPLGCVDSSRRAFPFMCSPFGDGLTDEETPLYLDAPPAVRALADAIASLERQTLDATEMSGTVLRYGWFYGPGTSYDPEDTIPRAIRTGHDADRGRRCRDLFVHRSA